MTKKMRSSVFGICLAVGFSAGSRAFAESAFERASSAFQRADFATAERELSRVGKNDTARADALLLQARIELVTGRYLQAEATAKTVMTLGEAARIAAIPVRAEALARQGRRSDAIALLREIENKEGARRARLLLGELLIEVGRRSEATEPLMAIIDDYNADKISESDPENLALVGRAAHLLRSPRDANDAFNAAEKAAAQPNIETLLFRADLFLDKYDPGHAGEVLKEALKVAPKHPGLRTMMARVKLDNAMDFDGAESEISQALEVDPNLAEAYFVRAGLALRDMDIALADAAADRGLKSDPKNLELLSMKAAIRFLADDPAGFEAVKAKVKAINSEYSRFFQIVGEFAEWEHRYDEIVRMMQEAVRVDPNDAKAHATLGLNLIRAGDEKGGLAALETAWSKDKFNVRVYNTLNLYEKEIAAQYVTISGKTFTVRYRKDEKPVLERYVPRMLERAYRDMVARYGFAPAGPIGVELYPDSEAFSIRTSGLPNVGIQGVCFGHTLAAMSPGAGSFNWGNVLWHELAHVFAIQMSKNHVPRWFTEGLSEYETIIARREWKREEEPALYAALKDERIPRAESFNRAFTHVDDVSDVTTAYFAASQMVVFLSEEFGFPKVVAMLPKWGQGKRTPEIVKDTLGISVDDLDRRFRIWLEGRGARYSTQYVPDLHAPPLEDARQAVLSEPSSAKRKVLLALALLEDGQAPEAQAMLSEALRLNPNEASALYVSVRLAFAEKDLAQAKKLLDQMISAGHDGYAVRMRAAEAAAIEGDVTGRRQHLERAHAFDPGQAEPLAALVELSHERKDTDLELTMLRKLALLDQHDRAVWSRLLELLVARGLWSEALSVGEGALFVDVMNPGVHRNYARALARSGQVLTAIYELNSALLCHPRPELEKEIYEELAKAYRKIGRNDYAEQALTAASK